MSAGNYIGYFAHLIEQGKMTEEEASKKLEELYEIDMKQDEFDREFFKNHKVYIPSSSFLTKEQTEAIREYAKKPIDINEEVLDKLNNIGCTSFRFTKEELTNFIKE